MKRFVIPSAIACICLATSAVDVSDTYTKQNISASTTFNATTTKQMTYPSGLPTPIFWFDATQTNGWKISGGTVTKIPSLVGDRFLTTDQTTGHFTAWTATGGTVTTASCAAARRRRARWRPSSRRCRTRRCCAMPAGS